MGALEGLHPRSQEAQVEQVKASYSEVVVNFGSLRALGPISLDVRAGEFLSIIGPSGCGKSTLLNVMAGILKPSEGRAYHKGRVVSAPNQDVGYITQKNHCLPWRTVRGNIRLPLECRNVPRDRWNSVVEQAIDDVGLRGFEDAYPAQLSGGMLQRVSVARTLSYAPSTLLLDEPFGSLDAQLRAKMHTMLMRLWEKTQTTVLFVTHDLVEAVTLSDRIVVLSDRPGTIEEIVDVDLSRPRSAVEAQADPEAGRYISMLWNLLN